MFSDAHTTKNVPVMFQNNLCPLFFVHLSKIITYIFFLFLDIESLVVGPQLISEEKRLPVI